MWRHRQHTKLRSFCSFLDKFTVGSVSIRNFAYERFHESFELGYGICAGVYVSMVLLLCGQFDILYASLKTLDLCLPDDSRQKLCKFDNNYDPELNQYFVSTERPELIQREFDHKAKLSEVLTDCVKHHQMLLSFAALFEDYFRWFLFPKLFSSGELTLEF